MQLSIREVSRLINVRERLVYQWIHQKSLPAVLVGEQYRVNRAELLSWVSAHQVDVSASSFRASYENNTTQENLVVALDQGGVLYEVLGDDLREVFSNIIHNMPVPEAVDRAFLLDLFVSRQMQASTAVGKGIAIPHVRFPVVLPLDSPLAMICFLNAPLPLTGPDGQAVDTLIVLATPTPKVHMQLLAQLATAVQDAQVCNLLRHRATTDEILGAVGSLLGQSRDTVLAGEAT